MTARVSQPAQGAWPSRTLLVILAVLACACSGPQRLTAKVTPCTTKEVEIVPSEFSRNGSTTAWCAECKEKLYVCVTNAERTRVQCRLAKGDDVCK